MHTLKIQSKEENEVIDITDKIEDIVGGSESGVGLCSIFLSHTSAALTTADLDPGTDLDMLDAFDVMIPDLDYRHPHDPEHVPDHILSTLIGTSITVPINDGSLLLGTWQRIVVFEFNGPRERQVHVTISNEQS